MVAIITDAFKRQVLDNIYDDVKDSNNTYYIGIGRSENWDSSDTPPVPNNTVKDVRDFRLSMQGVKNAEDVEYVIPRYNWSSGTIYSGFDDNVIGYPTNAYYVFTSENAVYMCIQQGRDANGNAVPSTVQPTGTLTYPVELPDGYVWKYLYTISALTATKFVSANYIPAQFITAVDSASSALAIEQKAVQDAAVPGQITGIAVVAGGTGYTSNPQVIIDGKSSKAAAATATVSGGSVVKIEMNDSNQSKALGKDYEFASINLLGGGGSGAKARAILSPKGGIGADARNDLRSTALMFNSQIAGGEGKEFITTNDFRQVAIIKNPKVPGTDSDFVAQVGSSLKQLKFQSIANIFSEDNTIVGSVSGAKAYIDAQDSNVIWYHQTEATGFTQFQEAETVTELDGVGEGILNPVGADADSDAFNTLKVNPLSGEIVYIDNRAAIERASEQTEDIKVIIQL
jgi:hypothetical protein